ncbi:transposable element Tcb2 transposase [Trichonephila clavipes]|nr:transposable element Tcb2 transposase [Trichonephila clavipes]
MTIASAVGDDRTSTEGRIGIDSYRAIYAALCVETHSVVLLCRSFWCLMGDLSLRETKEKEQLNESFEAVNQRVLNNTKDKQWKTEGDVRARRSTPAPYNNVGFSSIHRSLIQRRLRARLSLYRIHLTANHRRLHLQWAHEHRAWQADWHQVVFSDESRFNLWNHGGLIRVRH